MRAGIFILPFASIGLFACATGPQFETEPEAVEQVVATCDATQYGYLIGAPIGDVYNVNSGLVVRVLAADSYVPRDFDPNRLTFTTSTEDTVSRVFCG